MKYFSSVFLISSFLASSYSIASTKLLRGDMHGGGGDNLAHGTGAAWFLGQNEVKYCLVLAEDFGVERAQVEKEVDKAIVTWKKYIESKKINTVYPLESNLATSWKQLHECNGREDIILYFGSRSPEIEKEKNKYNNPSAFVHRISYDAKKHWGKGWVWFAPGKSVIPEKNFPNWNENQILQVMLLHELGHVYGCDHVDNTIMASDISELYTTLEGVLAPEYFGIDSIFGELAHDLWGDREYEGNLGGVTKVEKQTPLFVLLTGRKPQGKIRASVQIQGGFMDTKYTLTLSDDLGSLSKPLAPVSMEMSEMYIYGMLFNRAWVTSDGLEMAVGHARYSQSSLTTMLLPSGKKLAVEVIENTKTGSPLSIHYLNGEGNNLLFEAKLSFNQVKK